MTGVFFPLITLVWQTTNLNDTRSLQCILGTRREKNYYETNHALWSHYDMLYPTTLFFLKTGKSSINFILQRKKTAVELSE